VINLFRQKVARPSAGVLMKVLRKKCDFKDIGVPTLKDFKKKKSRLRRWLEFDA